RDVLCDVATRCCPELGPVSDFCHASIHEHSPELLRLGYGIYLSIQKRRILLRIGQLNEPNLGPINSFFFKRRDDEKPGRAVDHVDRHALALKVLKASQGTLTDHDRRRRIRWFITSCRTGAKNHYVESPFDNLYRGYGITECNVDMSRL